ncbi:MAG: hypothetical protein ACTSU5_07960 [Promethearchaeota archaeon]
MHEFSVEEFKTRRDGDVVELELPPCSPQEEEIVNPLIPPTSGIRIELLKNAGDGAYVAPASTHGLFLRIFAAISDVCGEMKGDKLRVLLVSDERPTSPMLLEEAARTFLAAGDEVFFQECDDPSSPESLASTPYGSAAVALFDEVDAVIVITASHNNVVWNGVKFYYELPIPISGDLMRRVSQKALEYDSVKMLAQLPGDIPRLPVVERNNEYVRKLLEHVVEFEASPGSRVVLWPFWGKAKGIVDLLAGIGVEVVLIEEEVNPPDPTVMSEEHKAKVTGKMRETGAKLAILLDADRDRIVFIIDREGEFVTFTPNELYTAMHNILARDFDAKLVNVRTIPSDPRCDDASLVNFITGVGYKHLGVVLYLLTGERVDESKFNTSILYYKNGDEFLQIATRGDISAPFREVIASGKVEVGDHLVFVLWEESGGHTFDLLAVESTDPLSFSSALPLVGDKFPAPAICVLTELVNRGYDLTSAVDQSIRFTRKEIHAVDREKLAMMERLEALVGRNVEFGRFTYKVVAFRDNEGAVETIGFQSDTSVLFIRPSGTGPAVRVYVFGPESSFKEEIREVKAGIEARFK